MLKLSTKDLKDMVLSQDFEFSVNHLVKNNNILKIENIFEYELSDTETLKYYNVSNDLLKELKQSFKNLKGQPEANIQTTVKKYFIEKYQGDYLDVHKAWDIVLKFIKGKKDLKIVVPASLEITTTMDRQDTAYNLTSYVKLYYIDHLGQEAILQPVSFLFSNKKVKKCFKITFSDIENIKWQNDNYKKAVFSTLNDLKDKRAILHGNLKGALSSIINQAKSNFDKNDLAFKKFLQHK